MNQPSKVDAGRIVIGIVLIMIGILAVIGQFFSVPVWRYLWPGFIILPGMGMFVGMLAGGKKTGGLAIPATILTILGLVLFCQNLFNVWWTWSFIWALVGPVATGLGIIIFGLYTENAEARHGGAIVFIIGLVLLAIFGLAFGLGRYNASGYIVPLVLIGLGIYIVVRRTRGSSPNKSSGSDDTPHANP
ncbi:MAG: hypothetical protein LLG44_05115 [Chloroflexi bacterium]|nr:hypothetical protein [Chloroflexota bacterium]